MCLSPNMLDDGTMIACRKCQLCNANVINDWTGRCIAEYKTANHTYFATLTYGPDASGEKDHIRATILTYSDFQKYAKKLRKTIGKFKYLVVGEYGKQKGRAHWHALLFTEKPIIKQFEFDKNIQQTDWDHGFTMMRKFNVSYARYCCKYVLKDQSEALRTSMFQMSKKPPLGHAYFKARAERMARSGLSPSNLKYSFADVRNSEGRPYVYMMRDKTAENFMDAYVAEWQRLNGKVVPDIMNHLTGNYDDCDGRRWSHSDPLAKYLNRKIQRECEAAQFRDGQRILKIIEENYGTTSQTQDFHIAHSGEQEYTAYCLKTGRRIVTASTAKKARSAAYKITINQDRWKRFHKPSSDDPSGNDWF